jgi:hypothetical protein
MRYAESHKTHLKIWVLQIEDLQLLAAKGTVYQLDNQNCDTSSLSESLSSTDSGGQPASIQLLLSTSLSGLKHEVDHFHSLSVTFMAAEQNSEIEANHYKQTDVGSWNCYRSPYMLSHVKWL